MARGINKVILVGNLGNDPETKYTQGGMAITTFSLATTSVRKDKDGQQIGKTEWHRVKLFGKVGEIAGEYLKKGRQVYIEGRIEYGSYEKDGVEALHHRHHRRGHADARRRWRRPRRTTHGQRPARGAPATQRLRAAPRCAGIAPGADGRLRGRRHSVLKRPMQATSFRTTRSAPNSTPWKQQ